MNISDNLRKYRKIRRMTLKELSANSNISISFISDIEHGRKKPSFQNAKRLADCLNMDVKLLLDKDKENLLNEITNPDLKAIINASKNMTSEECAELRRFAERLFPSAFNK